MCPLEACRYTARGAARATLQGRRGRVRGDGRVGQAEAQGVAWAPLTHTTHSTPFILHLPGTCPASFAFCSCPRAPPVTLTSQLLWLLEQAACCGASAVARSCGPATAAEEREAVTASSCNGSRSR